MKRALPILVAFLVVLGSGLVHGVATLRWEPSSALEAAVATVDQVPMRFGDWQGQEIEGDEQAFVQTGALGHWTRVYRGKHVDYTVILMCGKPGSMAVHTPDVCYGGVGYEMMGSQTKVNVDAQEFWRATFRKDQAAGASNLRLWWAWKSGGDWQAPAQARWTFRGSAYLYKLYVVRETSDDDRPEIDEEFLRALVPALSSACGLTAEQAKDTK